MKSFLIVLFGIIHLLSLAQNTPRSMKQGMELFYHEKYPEALIKFQKVANKRSSCDTKFWIGSCYFKMKDYLPAKKEFLSLILDTCQLDLAGFTMVNLGSCYGRLNQIDSSFYYFDYAIFLFPNHAEDAYFNKGQILYSLDRFEEARGCYDEAIKRNPDKALYYAKRQEINFILQDYDHALFDLEKAMTLDSAFNASLRPNLAYCYSMMDRYVKADSVYLTVYNENDAVFLNNYGFNKYKLGDFESGEKLIKQSLKLEPENSYAYRNLARIAIDKKDMKGACNYLIKAKELNFYSNYGSEVNTLLNEYCK